MPFTTHDAGVAIAVRLRPGASANRVTAVPEKGKANQAMIKLLAKAWDVPRSQLTVVAGAKGRNKILLLQGDPNTHLKMLDAWRRPKTGD
jgi:uncharacterized protein YggU (UPF0235/DUF167 family)